MKHQIHLPHLWSHRDRSAFTLVELLLVLATIGMLALVAAPAMSSARVPAKSMVCQNNLRQLARGWILYSADYKDKICRSGGMDVLCVDPTDANYLAGGSKANWVLGSVTTVPGNTDERFIKKGLLYPYVNDVKLYKCAADRRTADFPNTNGLPTLRSYSMNCWMNPIYTWPNGARIFRKQTDITRPATTFVFIEENPGTINDGWFICDPQMPTLWVDLPAAYHDDAANLTFADGHCEARKWTDGALLQDGITAPSAASQDPAHADLTWLIERSTY